MPKQIDIDIKESEGELASLVGKQSKLLQRQRAQALLLVKQGKVRYTHELAKKLKRERRTIYNWFKLYAEQGIGRYLSVKSRGSRKEVITKDIADALEAKLSDPSTEITSYVELVHWVEANHGVELNYKTLYGHCRKKFGGRLKVAGKPHHKKDEAAVEAFKKTPGTAKRDKIKSK